MTTPAEIARSRQGFYRFFSLALAPPEEGEFVQLTTAADLLDSLEPSRYAFWPQWCAVTSELRSSDGIDGLAAEHVRLFGAGAGGVLCPPVESFYRAGGQHETTGTIVTAIERDYRELGVAAGGVPDHVTTQLEIMAAMCAREHQAWEARRVDDAIRYLETERQFLRRHPARWVPELRERVHAAGASDFYAATLDAIHSFIVHDQGLIAELRKWSGVVA